MRLLITGGAGFIGSNLARLALQAGHEVRVLDDFSTGYEENLIGLDVHVHRSSVQDPDAVAGAVTGVDSIVHLGALGSVPRSIADPLGSHHANATGTLVLLDQAHRAGVPHVICASSSSVYGRNPALPKHERAWVGPLSPYAVTKLATEQYTLAYQSSFGLRSLAFRFFNVYGPGQRAGHAYAAVIPTWLDAISRGEPLWVNGDGTTSRDFTYVGSVAAVLLDAAADQVSHPDPVNLAFGTNTPLSTVLDQLRELAGRDLEVRYRDPRPGDVPHSQAASEALRALFPAAVPVPLEDGLAATFDWFGRLPHD